MSLSCMTRAMLINLIVVGLLCVLSFCVIGSSQKNLLAQSVDKKEHASKATTNSSTSTVYQCPIVSEDALAPHLLSQQKEDVTLLQWFNGLCNGTYIEMGALDGLRYSNTNVFNKMLGWKGVLIEMSPNSYKKLVKNRPNEIATVHAAVCASQDTVHWYPSKAVAVAGVWEFTTEAYRNRWWKNVTLEDTIPIQCSPLTNILQEHAPSYSFFDVFSLDVEGAEFQVLSSLDLNKIQFGVVIVENDTNNPRKNLAVEALLQSNGYFLLKRLGNNDIFVNNDFGTIYKDVLSLDVREEKMGPSDSPPTRSMDVVHEETCTPSCNCSNLQFYEPITNFTLQDVFTLSSSLSSEKPSTEAVCIWNGTRLHQHLPHWLQYMYRCWNWWMLHNETHQAVLEIPTTSKPFFDHGLNVPLSNGLWDLIKEAFSVKVIVTENSTESNTTIQDYRRQAATPNVLHTPWFLDADMAHGLREYVMGKIFSVRPLSGCHKLAHYAKAKEKPAVRIGVLDRKKTRHLLNHAELVAALGNLTSLPVSYATFEGVSFEKQVGFYSSVDVLVTPHGAQLSGVPFMPTCGCVLELLPKSYHIHNFFGSLTTSANLTSTYLYLSDGNATEEMSNNSILAVRRKARSVNLCPPVSSIVTSVRTLIDKWESCCAETM
jgi:FkbM family methyltransferase